MFRMTKRGYGWQKEVMDQDDRGVMEERGDRRIKVGIEDKIEKTKWMSCMKKFNRNRGTII